MENATNDLYSRQQELNLNVPSSLIVVGCGGIGSWVAIFGAMSGIPRIWLFDDDVLEESNRNRLPFCQGFINMPKVEAVAAFIRGIRPECAVFPCKVKCTPDILTEMAHSEIIEVVECTDSPNTQIELYNYCKKYNYLYIRAGYDGTHMTVTSNVGGWIKKEEHEDYTIRPSWVVPSATVAALAIAKVMRYPTQEVGIDLSEIGIPAIERMKRITARCRQTTATSEEEPRIRRRTVNGTQT